MRELLTGHRAGPRDPVHRDASRHRLMQPPQRSERIAQVCGETDDSEHSVRNRGDRGNDRHADDGTRDCGRRYVGQGIGGTSKPTSRATCGSRSASLRRTAELPAASDVDEGVGRSRVERVTTPRTMWLGR